MGYKRNTGFLPRISTRDVETRRLEIRRRANQMRLQIYGDLLPIAPGREFLMSIDSGERADFEMFCRYFGLVKQEDGKWRVK